MDSRRYQEHLGEHLLLYLTRFCATNFTFMQDNASVHAKEYLQRNNFYIMDWPTRFPHLNSIENLWGIIVRDVYDYAWQYDKVNPLKIAIQQAWDRLSNEQLTALIK